MCEFVNFSIAKKLKEKGFLQKYMGGYNMIGPTYIDDGRFYENGCITEVARAYSAPTISQVLKWLREEKGWVIVVRLYSTNEWYWFIQDKNGELTSSYLASCNNCFSTYELAALAGVEYVIDNLI